MIVMDLFILQKIELTKHSTHSNLAFQITLPYLYKTVLAENSATLHKTGLAEYSATLHKTGFTEHFTYTNLASQITLPYLYKTGLAEYSAMSI